MRRRLFNALCILSLLLAVAVAGLWGASYWRGFSVGFQASAWPLLRHYGVWIDRGGVFFDKRVWVDVGWDLSVFKKGRGGGERPWHSYPQVPGKGRLQFHTHKLNPVPQSTGSQWHGFDYQNLDWSLFEKEDTWISVRLPAWFVLLFLLVLPGRWYISPTRRRRCRIKAGQCGNCGYDLRGSPGPGSSGSPDSPGPTCPECGEKI